MAEKINVAVAGCGYWGPNLIRNFYQNPEVNLKKLCDLSQDRLNTMKAMYHEVELTTDYDEIVQDAAIDAVVIALPVHLHHTMAKQALEAGKHVLVEKPMASTAAQCRELNEIAKAKKLTLMVGHTFVYSAPIRKIKEIVDSGDLGQILYMSSRRLNLGLYQKDINVTWDLAPHDLSILFYVLNDRAVSVNCIGAANITPGIEDVTNLSINMEHHGFAMVQSSWLDPIKVRELTIVGNKRMLVFDDLEQVEKIKIYDKGVDAPPSYNSFADFIFAYRNGDMYSPAIKMVEPLKVEVQHFIDCIRTGTPSLSSGEEGLKVVEVLEASSQSLQQKGVNISLL